MAVTWKQLAYAADVALLSDTAPEDVTKAAAAAGSASDASRQDHKHDITTAAAGNIAPDDSAAEGSATSLARSDHTHGFANVAPTAAVDGGAAAEGSSSDISARADHKHALGPLAADLDFAGNEGKDMCLYNSAADPATPVLGKIYFKTGTLDCWVCTVIA